MKPRSLQHRERLSRSLTLHGDYDSPEYHSWSGMKQRCLNPNNPGYKNYGGRGVTVCDRWMSYENFLSDMGKKPEPSMSIERMDNEKGYCPENCKWGTKKEQGGNKRTVLQYTFDGRTLNLKDWSRELGINYWTLRGRLLKWHMTVEDAFQYGRYVMRGRNRSCA